MDRTEAGAFGALLVLLVGCAAAPEPGRQPAPIGLADFVRAQMRRLDTDWSLATANDYAQLPVSPALQRRVEAEERWEGVMQTLADALELDVVIWIEHHGMAVLAPRRTLRAELPDVGLHDALRLLALAAGKRVQLDAAVPDEPLSLRATGRLGELAQRVLPEGFALVDHTRELHAVPLPEPEDALWLETSERVDHELVLGRWQQGAILEDGRPLVVAVEPAPPEDAWGAFQLERRGAQWSLTAWVVVSGG